MTPPANWEAIMAEDLARRDGTEPSPHELRRFIKQLEEPAGRVETRCPATSTTHSPFDLLIDHLAERVAGTVIGRLPEDSSSPWLTTEEAIVYSRLPEGTFRKFVANGRISHNGTPRRHLFHREELDRDIRGL
jgi:hypothetical protein